VHALHLPLLEVTTPGHGRSRTTVDPSEARVGDVAAAIGLDPRRGVAVDGVAFDATTPVLATGLRRGSHLGPPAESAAPAGPVSLVVACDAGPDVTAPVGLPAGRHVVGRSAAVAVRVLDPDVEPHQLVLDVADDGTATLTQIAGRVPVAVDDHPVDAPTHVGPGSRIHIGASRLTLLAPAARSATAATEPAPGRPWSSTLVRQPRRRHGCAVSSPASPVETDARSGATGASGVGVVGVAAGLVASMGVAVALRQPMFAVFAAVGALVSASTWAAMHVSARRDARRSRRVRTEAVATYRDELAAVLARIRADHVATTPTASSVVADPRGPRCWERRRAHGDAYVVAVGWGDIPAAPQLVLDDLPAADIADAVERARLLCDVPVAVDLADRPRRCVAVAGPGAAALARSLVVQLAGRTGPADWRLVVAVTDPATAAWASWLPHTDPDSGPPAVIDACDDSAVAAALDRAGAGGRRLIVLTDRPQLVTARTGPLRRLLDGRTSGTDVARGGMPDADSNGGVTVIVTVGDVAAVPAACDGLLELGPRWRGRWTPDTSSGELPVRFHAAGLGRDVADATARALADLVDPEQLDSASELPRELRLGELPGMPTSAEAVLAEWRAGGADPRPVAAVGATAEHVVELDLVRDGPHALVAGTTGSGKSELLRTLVVSLAARSSPDHLTFVLVDYKGGSTFDACTTLPHTVGVVTDLDDGLAARALVSLEAELRRRERLLRAVGAGDLTAYRAVPGAPPLPRLVVVVDEFAALATELPDFLSALVTVAQRGRSLGMHLVLATQRPSGVVDDHIRANTAMRIALRLHDVADAVDVVGDATPVSLPRSVPGRVVARLGGDEPVVLQAARCSATIADAGDGPPSTELGAVVAEITRAASAGGYAAPHRPWLEPLPSDVAAPLGPGTVGIIDEPAEQRHVPLRWDRTANLALVGSLRSGTTTALCAVIAAAADAEPPAALHVYAIDGRGQGGLDALRVLAHCGAVVGVHEHERLGRLLRRLDAELGRRRASARDDRADVVVAIDGLATLRSTLAELDPVDGTSPLDRLLCDGPALGVTVVATLDPPAVSLLQRFGQRWVFHLDDPGDGPALGVPAARVPPPIPGRAVIVPAGLAAQVAALVPVPGTDAAGCPAPVATLPPVVRADELDTSTTPVSLSTPGPLVVGRRFDDLTDAVLHVHDGEHVLVVGPPGSGRTTALGVLAAAWRRCHPDGTVRSGHEIDVLGLSADAAPFLVVVDDAERFDDRGGALATALESRRTGLTVVAAGRGEPLRADYGTWTTLVRRSRVGFVMTAGTDADGELLGAVIPRRCPIPPRPGLAWMVAGRDVALVQLATP
jgi:DNA segregation ATPase FtsK/SpoIIIE, S-DNA-T family